MFLSNCTHNRIYSLATLIIPNYPKLTVYICGHNMI